MGRAMRTTGDEQHLARQFGHVPLEVKVQLGHLFTLEWNDQSNLSNLERLWISRYIKSSVVVRRGWGKAR